MAKTIRNVNFKGKAVTSSVVILFVAIIIYIIIRFFLVASDETISVYKVGDSNINSNFITTGLAIRDESVITASKGGYPCYFHSEGDKVRAGELVMGIDPTGNVLRAVPLASATDAAARSTGYKSLSRIISDYKKDYNNNDFNEVYNFRYKMDDEIFNLSNDVMDRALTENGAAKTSLITPLEAPLSGVVVYSTDGYEDLTLDNITEKSFDRSDYTKKSLKTSESLNAGDSSYKLITSDAWYIVCPITDAEKEAIEAEPYLKYTINGGEQRATSLYEFRDSFLIINMNKFLNKYMQSRFFSVEIVLDKYDGLKIPNSSVVRKEVYVISSDYAQITDSSIVIQVKTKKDDGTFITQNKTLKILHEVEEEGKYYIDPNEIGENDSIVSNDGKRSIDAALLEVEYLKGVYIVNSGIAEFNEISIIREGQEFTIVSKEGSLREYDNIVMDSSKVEENQIIY